MHSQPVPLGYFYAGGQEGHVEGDHVCTTLKIIPIMVCEHVARVISRWVYQPHASSLQAKPTVQATSVNFPVRSQDVHGRYQTPDHPRAQSSACA